MEHRVEAAWPLADLVLALGPDGAPIDVGPPDEVLRRSGERMAEAGIWLPDRPRDASDPAGPGARRPADQDRPERSSPPPDLGFAYELGAPVLESVDLTFSAGERIALVGPNGGGKSTLGRLLVGLLRPTTGRVRLGDADPSRLPAAVLARQAGYVFQDPEAGFLTDTVRDEVMLGLAQDEREAAPALMERLRLPLDEFGREARTG